MGDQSQDQDEGGLQAQGGRTSEAGQEASVLKTKTRLLASAFTTAKHSMNLQLMIAN